MGISKSSTNPADSAVYPKNVRRNCGIITHELAGACFNVWYLRRVAAAKSESNAWAGRRGLYIWNEFAKDDAASLLAIRFPANIYIR